LRIADLRGEQSRIDVEGEVTEKDEPREVNLRAGGTSNVCEITIRDESGSIKVTLWGEQINHADVGDRIRIINGYTKAYRGEISINIGKYGEMAIVS
jgi:replication factor A1